MDYLNIQDQLLEIKKLTLLAAKNVLDIEEVSLLTGLSVGRLHNLTCDRQIPFYRRGNNKKCYFDKHEIENWMKEYRVVTEAEAIQAAANYNLAASGL